MKKTLSTLAAALWLPLSGFADVVVLKDGSQITGTVQSAGSKQLLIMVGDDSQVIAMNQIASIEFNPLNVPAKPEVTAAPEPAAPLAEGPKLVAAPRVSAPVPTAPAAPAAPASTITIPAGTEIAARTVERINSKTADKYKEYAASLDDPIVVGGVTVAPVNATAYLRVTQIKNPKLKGKALVATTLVAIVVNGRRIELQTGDVDSQSGSQSKRTAVGAGAGAGAGAAVGAAAGGGVGAAVGAGIGAAAGTIGAALTSKGVQIPPETRFTYKLNQDAAVPAENAK